MSEKELTRSTLLKRAGAGAAVLWAAPVLTSTAAAADESEACKKKCKNGATCSNDCGNPLCKTHPNGTDCFCYASKHNNKGVPTCCVCKGNIFCSDSPLCNNNNECVAALGAGAKCTINCCNSFPTRSCVPACGNGISGAIGAGATAAG